MSASSDMICKASALVSVKDCGVLAETKISASGSSEFV